MPVTDSICTPERAPAETGGVFVTLRARLSGRKAPTENVQPNASHQGRAGGPASSAVGIIRHPMASTVDSGEAESLFTAHLPVIERVIAFVCRRHHLSADETGDFASHVRIKLLSDNCAVLRAFGGRSSMQTYLTVVITRYLLDVQRESWGKWRPSAEATRMGPVAVLLDRLLTRDGYSVDEAHEIITTNHQLDLTRADVERIVSALPQRQPRRFETDERLADRPAPPASTDIVADGEAIAGAPHVAAALQRALGSLSPQDRLVLTMRFRDGVPVVQIASALGLDQRALFRRIEKMLRDVRRRLERDGIDRSLVLRILESERGTLELARHLPEIAGEGPSMASGASEWR